MALLKLSLILLLCTRAFASGEDLDVDPRDKVLSEQAKLLCDSTDEYINTLKFLHKTKEIVFTENTSRKIAEKVSAGCNGAAERFAQILTLLKTVGLSDRSALKMALEFSAETPDVQKNFLEIFTRSFMSEFFDYQYPVAAQLAFELSRDYHGDPTQVREDFIDLVRFCKDGKNLDLPANQCAEFTIRLARLTQYHPQGIRGPFQKLFKDLRTKREFGLDIKTALQVSYDVLKSGPRAPENFLSAYAYASKKDGLDYDRRQALAFALRMADRSFVGAHPPLVPGPTVNDALETAADDKR
jgi:hypothetical protein